MKSGGVKIKQNRGVVAWYAGGAGARHGPPEVPPAEAGGGIGSVVGSGLGWRVPAWGCHKLSGPAAEGQSLVEAWVDVGVLVEGRRGKGPF